MDIAIFFGGNMSIAEILNSPWAIVPEKLQELCEIYATHLRGDKIDIAAIEARIGKPLKNQQPQYSVEGGVAIIPIEGVLAKKMNLFAEISGGVSTQMLAQTFQNAADDPTVHSIILAIDSPGGTVDGTQNVADVVFANRGKKKVVALASGMMASAAYWIGSAADQVLLSSDTDIVGSIGVVATHIDYSRADDRVGVKVTEISAGKYKRIASKHEPLTPEGRQSIQDQIDHVYSVFVDNVAKHRGVSSQVVLDKMADGRLFLGKKARDAGLVDGVSTMSALVSRLNQEREGKILAVWQAIRDRITASAAGSPKSAAAESVDALALAERARQLQLADPNLTNVQAVKLAYTEAGVGLQ
jgi:signal peptide peptidase SppA